jgi:acyl-coenzyme A thioesterase PaaI-like protein
MEVKRLDYEAVRAGLEAAIPYNRHVGLQVAEVGEGRGVITLPEDDRLHNHVGSQHAGALFSAGEAASGAAFVGAFAEHMGNITPLARSADISYGKVEFPVKVDLADANGNTVAEMTVNWHVRKNS